MRVLGGKLYKTQDSLVTRVAETLRFGVLPIHGERVLRKVVGADAEKIDKLRERIAYQSRRGGFYHYSKLYRVGKRQIFRFKLRFCLVYPFKYLPYLAFARNHRKHYPQPAVNRGSVERAKLRLKNFRLAQTNTYRAVAESGIFLLAEIKIIDFFVRSDVERSDYDPLPRHTLQHALICLKLQLLVGKIAVFQIQKLAAEKSYSARVVYERAAYIGKSAYIGVNFNLFAVKRYVFLAL